MSESAEKIREIGKMDKMQKMLKMQGMIFAWILGAVLLLAGCAKEKDFSGIEKGDIVEFGTYEQNDFLLDGQEPIRWEVLAVEDGKAVLISEYCLSIRPMNEERTEVTWEDCTLRKWLNGKFIELAFTQEEQDRLVSVEVDNGDSYSEDKVFLLSLEELELYYGEGWQDEMESRAPMTKYVAARYPWDPIAKNMKDRPKKGDTISWWLRTPGKDKECFEVVDGSRHQYSGGQVVSEKDLTGVRPVIVVEVE